MGTYLLSVASLLNSTKGVQQEVVFHTLVSVQSKEEYLVQLWIADGRIRSYMIKEAMIKETGTGRVVSIHPEQVFDFLDAHGVLAWSRGPSPAPREEGVHEHPPLPQQPKAHARLVSERRPVRHNHDAPLTNFNHLQRQVFSLSDGTRGVEGIARLLSKDPRVIMAILQELQAQELMTFDEEEGINL